MKKTKDRILHVALDLFSQNGYDAVSVAQIADAVGIKAPSLYKHFKSKQDIFDAIITKMNERYVAYAHNSHMDGVDANKDKNIFEQIDIDVLVTLGKQIFTFFVKDEFQSKFRKMIIMEQYHNPKLAKLYMKQYHDDALTYQTIIFSTFMEKGIFVKQDPRICALHFFGPIFSLMTLCDAQPERIDEAMELVEAHIRQFSTLYSMPKQVSL